MTSKALRSTAAGLLSGRVIGRRPIPQEIFRPHRNYATDNKQPRKDFNAQLWESSSARVQREREDQARYAEHRELGKSRVGSSIGATLGLLLLGGGFYYLGTLKNPLPNDEDSTLPLTSIIPPRLNTSTGNMQAAWTDLKNIVGEDNVSTSADDIDGHAGSSWSTHWAAKDEVHFAIVRPETTEEVSEIMKVCHKRRIPVTGYSGGTSLEGHYAATRGGICIDFIRMDQIVALHEEDMDVVVQPACGWEALNSELEEHGLFFPPDPGPGAMIGGMVGTGCSGTNAYRYGTMKDWVLSLTVVMADGTIVKTRQRPRKSSAGYDLTRLFIGSEGTLGLVTEATLKVTAKPINTRVAAATFPTIKDAAECVFRVVRQGIPIAAVEILDDVQMKCINDVGSTTRQWAEEPSLFFKFAGTSDNAVKEAVSAVQKVAKEVGSKSFEFAKDDDEGEELWSARKEALWSMMAKKREETDHVWTTDVAVPLSQLPTIIEETKRDMYENGVLGSIVGHVGDGNFHAIIVYNEKERTTVEEVVHRMVKRAIELEGTSTGEHGVGLVKRDYLQHELSPDTVDAMRKIKRAWDPLCLLNCDKIVRGQKPKEGEVMEW